MVNLYVGLNNVLKKLITHTHVDIEFHHQLRIRTFPEIELPRITSYNICLREYNLLWTLFF